MIFLSTAISFASLALQLLLLYLLFSGPARKYAVLIVYAVAQLATTVAEQVVFRSAGPQSDLWFVVYWTDEILLDALVFVMVILLTYRALENSPIRPSVGRFLVLVSAAAVTLPFILFYRGQFDTAWLNASAQWLNFGAAVLNLALWTAIIGTRNRDRQILMVSAGLGVLVTGSAVSFGLRQFTVEAVGAPRALANLFGQVTHLAGVSIWCWAFWRRKAAGPRAK